MAKEIHYEVFRRIGAKGGWTLHDVRSDRDSAIELAQGLMKAEKATGVKWMTGSAVGHRELV